MDDNYFARNAKRIPGYNSLRSRVEKVDKEKLKEAGETIKSLAWDEKQKWYLRSTFLTIAGRVVRFLAVIFLWVTCFLAFAYYPYHLQIRRIGMMSKSAINAATLFEPGSNDPATCPNSVIHSLEKPFNRLTLGDNLGFAPYSVNDEDIYKQAKEDMKDDPLSVFNVWEDMQFFSRMLAIGEWFLLLAIILYSIFFINYAIVGTVLMITGRKIQEGNFVSKYEFWSQVIFFVFGSVTAAIVFSHDIWAFQLQDRQLKVGEAYKSVCIPDVYDCFSNGEMQLCDFLRADDSPSASSTICDSNFIVPQCHIFGQSEATAAEVISFGQYAFGGYECSDNFCPDSDNRDTEVRMASKAMWESLQEGPELSLGVTKYSFNSTQGMIISMHVFGWLFVIFTLLDLAMLIYSVVVISVSNEWSSVVGKDIVDRVDKLKRGLKVNADALRNRYRRKSSDDETEDV